ncbi:hypothetical protein SAMN05216349_10317 [Oribacterium sp. KHPX15]|uniref:hypothetical protein n=1 Tax=Oribacterium sp. KHPX15 TaxID=1855342 RepID=UPI00089A593C|nr:hypothetical protein [Oribacterium sp. KHPX15]SDZ95503.1 hypothetical protein SAMN05216349_10317 [Oribacterium sp. KHPX15]
MSKKIKGDKLTIVAYTGLVIAVLSAFTTIVGYTNRDGVHRTFTIIDFLKDANGFGSFVFNEYTGKGLVVFAPWQLYVLIALGTVAIICSFIGLMKLSKQTDNRASYALTILGLIGTMAPSVVLFIEIFMLKSKYLGEISCGIYPIVSPIAMIVCIAAAVKMRRRNNQFRKKFKEAEGLIYRGGNL